MPLYIEAFLADTAGLTLEEQGAYIRLLCHMWINCGKLVDNNKIIARILGVHVNKWLKIRQNLEGYLPSNPPGYLSNPRLQKELDRVNENRTKKALAANTRWIGNSLKNNGRLDAGASDVHMQKECGCICRCIPCASPYASILHRHTIPIFNNYNYLDLTVVGKTCGKFFEREEAERLVAIPTNDTVH
jgi:uncharacterized protein YdaU (DUF1376 family)